MTKATDSKADREARWWADWFEADFGWDGLSKHIIPTGGLNGEKNLQEYWRRDPATGISRDDAAMRDAGELIDFDGRVWHLAHLPPHGRTESAASSKADPNHPDLARLNALVATRVAAGVETPGKFGLKEFTVSGPDGRARLDGAVLVSAPNHPQGSASLLHLSCRYGCFGQADLQTSKFGPGADFRGATFTGAANFFGATFAGGAEFGSATFAGAVDFGSATFTGYADFGSATFTDYAFFKRSSFTGYASFGGATFSGLTDFGTATFSGPTYFGTVTFTGELSFSDATFTGVTTFRGATFAGYTSFIGATFTGDPSFSVATFTDDVYFDDATFTGEPSFTGTTFTGDANFGGATFTGYAFFSGATFAGYAFFSGATFAGYAAFRNAVFLRPVFFSAHIAHPECQFAGAFRGARFAAVADFSGAAGEGRGGLLAAAFGGAQFEKGLLLTDGLDKKAEKIFPALLWGARDAARADLAREKKDRASKGSPFRWLEGRKFHEEAREHRLVELESGCRTLKVAMGAARDEVREQRYYRFQLRARHSRSDVDLLEKLFGGLYGLTSNYGSGLLGPLFSLVLLTFVSGLGYWAWADHLGVAGDAGFWEGQSFALSVVFKPFAVLAAAESDPAVRDWWPVALMNVSASVALGLRVVTTLQSLASGVLIFLLAVGVRRRFQIG